MKKEIEIFTYFILVGSDNNSETLHDRNKFSDWDDVELYLKDRIQLKRKMEVFKIEILGVKFSEFNSVNFNSLIKIKEFFLSLLNDEIEANAEKEKRSRIELRIDEKQKQEVLQKCKEININISEYTRQLYKYGEIRIVSEQLTRDIRGMAVNLNQIAKRINSGATSENSVISELQSLLSQLQNTYNNQ
ncbi:MAG: plasmid mobilization relaxosome protein MobC [Cloacibacterium sp.]|jgi:hypothetical protein|nr:plasmid mobilization relaxosome protein MobC [Cloacibacterium sp.]